MKDRYHKIINGRVVAVNLPRLTKEQEDKIKKDSEEIVKSVQRQLEYLHNLHNK